MRGRGAKAVVTEGGVSTAGGGAPRVIGHSLKPYRVVKAIGAGGMGRRGPLPEKDFVRIGAPRPFPAASGFSYAVSHRLG